MPEWLQNGLSTLAVALTVAIGGWAKAISGRVQKLETNDALQDQSIASIPVTLKEIRDEIKGLRDDGRVRSMELYKHIDGLRLEIKADLAGKVDKSG